MIVRSSSAFGIGVLLAHWWLRVRQSCAIGAFGARALRVFGPSASEVIMCVVVDLLVGLVLGSLLTALERKVLGSGQRRSGPS